MIILAPPFQKAYVKKNIPTVILGPGIPQLSRYNRFPLELGASRNVSSGEELFTSQNMSWFGGVGNAFVVCQGIEAGDGWESGKMEGTSLRNTQCKSISAGPGEIWAMVVDS